MENQSIWGRNGLEFETVSPFVAAVGGSLTKPTRSLNLYGSAIDETDDIW
jgi:hypothetical protein